MVLEKLDLQETEVDWNFILSTYPVQALTQNKSMTYILDSNEAVERDEEEFINKYKVTIR